MTTMMNYNNLTLESTRGLINERDHLIFSLSNDNPFTAFSPSEKRIAQSKLDKVKFELRKPYR